MERQLMLVTLLLVVGPATARGGDLKDVERSLNHEFKGKTVTLRNYYRGERLAYNADGELLSGKAPGTWTLDSHLQVEAIKVKSDRLEMRGYRSLAAFDTRKGEWHGFFGREVLIEIAAPQGELTLDRAHELLLKVFFQRAEEIKALVPSYWNPIVEDKKPDQIKPGERGSLDGNPIESVSPQNGVSAPIRVFTPQPEYTDGALQNKLSGTIKLAIIVDGSGSVRDVLEVSPPLGRGLDQSAIEMVRSWKFKPALKAGVPVPVRAVVETTFRAG